MEVKDVYEATVHIENALKKFGGFVTKSELQSQVIEEETYNTSDQNAVLLRKFNSYKQDASKSSFGKIRCVSHFCK